MKGIPKSIATKVDLQNICKDASPSQAMDILNGLSDDDIIRLRISNVDIEDLTKTVKARQRVIDRQNAALVDARKKMEALHEQIKTATNETSTAVAKIRDIEKDIAEAPAYVDLIETCKHEIIQLELTMAENQRHERKIIAEQARIAAAVAAAQNTTAKTMSEIQRCIDERERLRESYAALKARMSTVADLEQQHRDARDVIKSAEAEIPRLERLIKKLEA